MHGWNAPASWALTYEELSWREQISLGPFTMTAPVFQTNSIQCKGTYSQDYSAG